MIAERPPIWYSPHPTFFDVHTADCVSVYEKASDGGPA